MVSDGDASAVWAGPTRVVQLAGQGPQWVQEKIRIAVSSGAERGRQVDMVEDRLLIGTHPQCDLVLPDPSVSREHAQLLVVPEGLLFRDLGSTNGSWGAGFRLREALLPRVSEVVVGSTRLSISALDEQLTHELSSENRFGSMIGASPIMRALFSKLERVAQTEATVLLQGESGTGKELAARAIHNASRRADGPFVVVDCGALPRELIESELFGHERGAFTGASHSRQGAFEQANGGTLFLDEIGELDLDLQPRLLRALESRSVKRVGGNQQRAVDIRVVAATNRDLAERVAGGAFREDLFFRLAVVQLTLPPLRARRDDIPLLVEAFVDELSAGRHPVTISDAMMQRLTARAWPGNARELRNIVERALALGGLESGDSAEGGANAVQSSTDSAPASGPAFVALRTHPYKVARGRLLDAFERDYLTALLEQHEGNLTQSARTAQIDRVYLLRLLDKHDMRKR
jgi:DNA-binding NtrC family response regulator